MCRGRRPVAAPRGAPPSRPSLPLPPAVSSPPCALLTATRVTSLTRAASGLHALPHSMSGGWVQSARNPPTCPGPSTTTPLPTYRSAPLELHPARGIDTVGLCPHWRGSKRQVCHAGMLVGCDAAGCRPRLCAAGLFSTRRNARPQPRQECAPGDCSRCALPGMTRN
jgi:hypothetical protein